MVLLLVLKYAFLLFFFQPSARKIVPTEGNVWSLTNVSVDMDTKARSVKSSSCKLLGCQGDSSQPIVLTEMQENNRFREWKQAGLLFIFINVNDTLSWLTWHCLSIQHETRCFCTWPLIIKLVNETFSWNVYAPSKNRHRNVSLYDNLHNYAL